MVHGTRYFLMFIGLVGLPGTGTDDVSDLLVSKYDFSRLYLTSETCSEEIAKHVFESVDSLVDFVTVNFQKRFVIIHEDISRFTDGEWKYFERRPFYCTIAVDASLCTRRKRLGDNIDSAKLETGCCSIFFRLAHHVITNDLDMETLELSLVEALKILTIKRRPSWDSYFIQLAYLTSQRSNCMKRKVGAVLVTRESHRIIATGYNGTPFRLKNCSEGGCLRCNSNDGRGLGLEFCYCLHAEENAILEAGRERISLYNNEKGVVIYCTTFPCISCAKKILQSGICEVVYSQSYHHDSRVNSLFEEAGIVSRRYE